MSNKMIAFGDNGGLPANPAALANLGGVVAAGAGMGTDLLRLTREGVWCYGADNIEPEEDSQWGVNPYSFKQGYIAWLDGKVEAEHMVPFTQPIPAASTLPDVESTSGWQLQLSVELKCLNGEDEGVQVCYKVTSIGGRRALSALAQAIVNRQGEGAGDVVPVVMLETDSYKHKQYGKIYTPEFKVVSWLTMDADPVDDSVQDSVEEVDAEPVNEPVNRRGKGRRGKVVADAEDVEVSGKDTDSSSGDDAGNDTPAPQTRRRRRRS